MITDVELDVIKDEIVSLMLYSSSQSNAKNALIEELFKHHVPVPDDKSYWDVARHHLEDKKLVREFLDYDYHPKTCVLEVSWQESLVPDDYWIKRIVRQTREVIRDRNFSDVRAKFLQELDGEFWEENALILALSVMYDHQVELEDHKEYLDLAKLRR